MVKIADFMVRFCSYRERVFPAKKVKVKEVTGNLYLWMTALCMGVITHVFKRVHLDIENQKDFSVEEWNGKICL